VTVARIPPLLPDAPPDERAARALERLEDLVDLYDRGMREPLPLYCETSAAYAAGGRAGETLARKAWTSSFGQAPREDRDAEHVLVLGANTPFDDLLAPAPREDETGDGWTEDPTRLGRYAHRLWDGLLAVEDVGDQ
jgi:exodeoxyribonuclease V gamma subunit